MLMYHLGIVGLIRINGFAEALLLKLRQGLNRRAEGLVRLVINSQGLQRRHTDRLCWSTLALDCSLLDGTHLLILQPASGTTRVMPSMGADSDSRPKYYQTIKISRLS